LKPLVKGGWAVCFLNRSVAPRSFALDWSKNSFTDSVSTFTLNLRYTVYRIRDLWARKELGSTQTALLSTLLPHDVLMLKLTKQ